MTAKEITILRLHELIESRLFDKVKTLHALLVNGIMDFLVAQKDQPNEADERRNIEMQLFKNSVFSPDNNQNMDGQNPAQAAAAEAMDYTGQLKEQSASLDIDKIKPADRVTFLLNYIYIVLTNNQFAWASCAEQISLLREIFLAVLDPYIQILSLWVSNGELTDPYQEFFIKVNPKLQAMENATARQHWEKSFEFRSINLREFEDRLFGFGNDGDRLASNKIEISIPIFLRKHIQSILSIGKSIKIIRFIESENIGEHVSMPTDVYTRYKAQLEKIVSNPYPLVDTTGAHLASEDLSTAWNARHFSISDHL